MKIMIVDGQGGGIGAMLIKELGKIRSEKVEIMALGTNSIATSNMMKAGANKGATGQNAIVLMSKKADLILGSISIIMANAMMGEVTPSMAEAICTSGCKKILIPLSQENITIIGIISEPLPHLVAEVIEEIKEKFIHV